MNSFAIYVEPTAPVALGRRLNLDAILAYLLLQRLRAEGVEEDEALHRAHTEIPLAQVGSVFAGSSALIARTRITRRTLYGNFGRHVGAIPDFENAFEKNLAKRVGGRDFDRIEGRYQTIVSTFDQYHLHKPNSPYENDREWGIWFVGYGDREATKSLMADLRYIGAKRTPCKQPVFHDVNPSQSPGLLGHDGTVLRPVPCETDLEPTNFSYSYERFRPPYWRSSYATDPVRCYVPPQTMWPNTNYITDQLIGVI